MVSTPTTSTAASTGTTSVTTYTTLPLSTADVISRSTQNLSGFLSRRRPWPEFLAPTAALDLPASFSAAVERFRRNFNYFAVNYAIIVSVCSAVWLIGSPIALIAVGIVSFLWLVFHFFREDPVLIAGRHVSNKAVILCLVAATIAAVWFTGALNNLSIGIAVGVLLSIVHGVLRNPERLFLDENDAVSNGLIASNSNRTRVYNGFNPPL